MAQAFIFVPLLACFCVFAWIFAIHAAHYFLVVVVSSGAGGDRVEWPDEPLLDWFWKVFYLGFLMSLWLAPALIVGRTVGGETTTIVVATLFYGLMFPLSLLSSLAAPTKWLPFYPPIVPRLAQRSSQTMGFYLRSVVPLVVGGASMWVLAGNGGTGLVILAAVLLPAAWMVYARLLGRLAFVLTFTKGPKKKRKRPRRARPDERPESSDPWAVPDEEEVGVTRPSEATPHSTMFGDVVGYDLTTSPPPPPPPTPVFVPDEENEPVPLAESEPDEPEVVADDEGERPRRRRRRAGEDFTQSRHIPEPKRPFDATMWTFLFDAASLQAWVRMAFGVGVVGGIWRGLLSAWPE